MPRTNIGIFYLLAKMKKTVHYLMLLLIPILLLMVFLDGDASFVNNKIELGLLLLLGLYFLASPKIMRKGK